MDSPLRYVYFANRCNACGGEFVITLLDVLQQHRLTEEWTGARPCAECHGEYFALLDRVPADLLRTLAQAWEQLSVELESRSLRPFIGVPAGG